MLVAIISDEEYDLINGQDYDGEGSLYYPVKDADDNWVISELEIINTVHSEFDFLHQKELIEWNPPVVEW